MSETEIYARLDRQIGDEERLKYATWSYDSNQDFEEVHSNIDKQILNLNSLF